MANSSSNLQLVSTSQSQKEVTINALANSASQAMFGAIRSLNGFSITLYGGNIYRAGALVQVANASITLTASRRNFIYLRNDAVIALSTAVGTPTAETVIPADAYLLYVLDVGSSSVSSYTDYRFGTLQNHLKRNTITVSNANVTINWLQANADVLIASGTLTANVELILPAFLSKEYTIINKTTGAFTLTASTGTAAKVTITSGTARAVVSDGVDLYAIV